ncbi:hypothetical protein TSOC_004769, partial [Tetrabaena socialis]
MAETMIAEARKTRLSNVRHHADVAAQRLLAHQGHRIFIRSRAAAAAGDSPDSSAKGGPGDAYAVSSITAAAAGKDYAASNATAVSPLSVGDSEEFDERGHRTLAGELALHLSVYRALQESVHAIEKWQLGVHRWQVK